jgi:AcrR family transcriptional regulator
MYICSSGAVGFKKMKEQLEVPEKNPVRPADVSASRQAERSERTRSELLRAAEASRIEDIAAEAGRSRGAFYANFASKTEVFLALRSLAVRRRAREIRQRVERVHGQQERHDAVIGYLMEQVCDTQSLLLQIEFKLFALRHPDMLAELAEKHLETATSINRQELSDLFPEKNESLAESRSNTLLMEALLEGFGLNAMFSPEAIDIERLRDVMPRILGTIFPGLTPSCK